MTANTYNTSSVVIRLGPPCVRLGCHRLSLPLVDEAFDHWGFNCGPGALCAITGLNPSQLRPFLGNFERRWFMNPTLMRSALEHLGIRFQWNVIRDQCATQAQEQAMPEFGLCRIQFGGPWCNEGVPMQARYKQTHWIATSALSFDGSRGVFDVNNNTSYHHIGWISYGDWANVVAPELSASYPRADGTWWVTHSAEVRT